MAEMITAATNGKNARENRFQIPRIDLTPMVDLGFLLLTFFVFSSTLSTQSVMQTTYPDDRENKINDGTQAPESGTLTLLLGANNQVYYYEGLSDETGKTWKSSHINDIRNAIVSKKSHTVKDDFVVLIKPGNHSSYNNLVSILNEMKISTVARYSIVDPTQEEEKKL
ncbi:MULTISPECIES: ExbD/TolR family protein [Chitinophagaceae]